MNIPCSLFVALHKFFQLNLDETCFLCNDGELRILGDGEKPRHDKNTSDTRLSITVLRVGSAGGIKGPVFFIAKGTETTANRVFTDKLLVEKYEMPIGSTVLFNDSAYVG